MIVTTYEAYSIWSIQLVIVRGPASLAPRFDADSPKELVIYHLVASDCLFRCGTLEGARGRGGPAKMVNRKFGLLGALMLGLTACANSGFWPQEPFAHADILEFQRQVRECWTVPPNTPSFTIALRVQLNANGTLLSSPLLLNPETDEIDIRNFRLATESAVHAVAICAPYRLPSKSYRIWNDVIIYLNPAPSADPV